MSFKIFISVIWALISRETKTRFGEGYLGYCWVFLEPFIHVGLWVLIFTLMHRHVFLGLNIPIFILTGIVPYLFFSGVVTRNLSVVNANKSLLFYRQVKIFDAVVARWLLEMVITTLTIFGGLLVFDYFSYSFILYNPLSLIVAFLLLSIIALGLGFAMSVVGFFFPEIGKVIGVFFRILYYISGVFFSLDQIPVQYQWAFLWNPIFQAIEFIRYAFVQFTLPQQVSFSYLGEWALFSIFFGVSLYFVARKRFLMNAQAR